MKILLISEYFPKGKSLVFSGGVEARTFYVAKHLAKKHQVHVITSKLKGTKSQEKFFGINIHRVGQSRNYQANAHAVSIFSLISFTKEAIKIGISLNPDIVDGGNFICHFIAKRISQKNKIPVVFWYPDVFIGQWLKTSGLISGFSGWILEKYNLFTKADCFISISKQTSTKLIKNHINSSIIKTIPCGIDLKEFKSMISRETPPVITCINRLVPYKNVEDIIWAYAFIVKNNIRCSLKIIGTGQEEVKLKKITLMLGLKKTIHFYKNLPRKELIKLLKSSTVLCSASTVEGFGINIIEAAASGAPYVLSNIKVFKEITKNGKGGLFFKINDIKDLASKLTYFLQDKAIYKRKQSEALNLAKYYDWEKVSRETEDIYKSLI